MDSKNTAGLSGILKISIFMLSFFNVHTLNPGYFWQVTDFHYDHSYLNENWSCVKSQLQLNQMGDEWCDSPWSLVEYSIQAMKNIREDVDFLIWTGDNVAHISDDIMNVSINLDILKNITLALTAAFPNKKIYPIFGNHDYYPTDQFPDGNNLIYNSTAEMWKQWIGEEQLDNFRRGGYYTLTLPASRLRLVALNTNLYYRSNRVTVNMTDPSGQLDWLRVILQGAKNNSEKVLIIAHVPPGIFTPLQVVPVYHPQYIAPFDDILREYASLMVGVHFGHEHHDGFKIIYDNQDNPAASIFIAPSVTPWRFKRNDDTYGPAHNPGIRLVMYDRDTGLHLDIHQYRLNFSAIAMNQSHVNFTQLYSFQQQYNVSDLSAASLNQLVGRMENGQEGKRLLEFYYRFTTAGAEQEEPLKSCSEVCAASLLCGFKHYTAATFSACVDKYTSLFISSTPKTSTPRGSAGINGPGIVIFSMTAILLTRSYFESF